MKYALRTARRGKYHLPALDASHAALRVNRRPPTGDPGLCGRLDPAHPFPSLLHTEMNLKDAVCMDCVRKSHALALEEAHNAHTNACIYPA